MPEAAADSSSSDDSGSDDEQHQDKDSQRPDRRGRPAYLKDVLAQQVCTALTGHNLDLQTCCWRRNTISANKQTLGSLDRVLQGSHPSLP